MSHVLDESKLEEEIIACKEWWVDKRNFDEDDASDIAWDFETVIQKVDRS